ncbi:hypothetical protein [Gordonia sihwensis]|uniref:hypothetical protein n=1 Tax=Gordonia sihwensis TaxID=173559 RepID=UPI0005EF848C|nr:hypothetical protein [Gordonia sihwensis]KJR06898.1 hypothetical protein UG54_12425 [Gordonia sihwensis]
MLTWENLEDRIGRNWAMVSRLVLATVLYYAVSVLYHGTVGYAGGEVFTRPLTGTAIFAGIMCIPAAAGWYVSRRFATAGDA